MQNDADLVGYFLTSFLSGSFSASGSRMVSMNFHIIQTHKIRNHLADAAVSFGNFPAFIGSEFQAEQRHLGMGEAQRWGAAIIWNIHQL
jgi:hypothetical protein